MNLMKKLTTTLLVVLAVGAILTSCSTTNGVKEDVKKGSEKVENGTKDIADDAKEGIKDAKDEVEDGAKDIKDGAEKAVDRVAIIGTWKGQETDGDTYTLNLFADLTYEVVKIDDGKTTASAGKYSIKGDIITLNREKKLENSKTIADKDVETLKYKLNKEKLTITKDGESKGITLTKESKALDKIIK